MRNQNIVFLSLLLASLSTAATSAPTDLASAPIHYLAAAQVKPNILFILDDSGSMQWSYLGDEVAVNNYENTVGYRSSLCNKVYYNPQIHYLPPVNADGSSYPDQNFTGALYDGYQSQSDQVNLGTSFMAWRNNTTTPTVPVDSARAHYASDCTKSPVTCDVTIHSGLPNGPEPAYYYTYQGNQLEHLGDNSANDQCKDIPNGSNASGSSNWTKVVVGANEQTNFANWFSYYRTRILTMKTAVAHAFRDLGDHFRVGFAAISYSGVDLNNPGFLKIDVFNAQQKSLFYSRLNAINPTASTPLRGALAKAGQIYAGRLLSVADDPVQFSCQRNYSILSTDGYWNTSWESASYGPKKIDGSTDVGNQDGDLPRPMYDGSGNAAGSNSVVTAAQIEVLPQRGSADGFAYISSITVNGQSLMSYVDGVMNTTDVNADAEQLASRIATTIGQAGFHALAQGRIIIIVAPDSAGPISATPVVSGNGGLRLVVRSFQPVPASARTLNTLADVAAYYYRTDLRTEALSNCRSPKNVCTNNVPAVGSEPKFQHMNTFTLGLGANGTLHYQENYEQAASGDFHDISTGLRNWPDPIYFDGPERVDDLWHAAVNGGGKYFNAQNPESLAHALSSTLSAIQAASGASAAAATSSQEPVAGDNTVYISRYRSVYWDGELEARSLNLADGNVTNTVLWSASTLLDQRVSAASDDRKIFTYSDSTANHLKDFRWSALTATERAYFSDESQVNFLRGQRDHEDRAENVLRPYRLREHVLGALINAQPLVVSHPAFSYADENYGVFRDEQQASRKSIVYAAANDGMLHAFNAASGVEEWAFMPSAVLPQVGAQSDKNFSENFHYLLDASPVAADICPRAPANSCSKSEWRTILIGGLAGGGRQFYALDITNPDTPQALWQFGVQQDQDLGYSYGKPVITKRRDGRWVVILSSGYNNIAPGDGKGYLTVLDAASGVLLNKIGTGAGSATNPSGLAQINAWIESPVDNTASRFYGGDLLGNLWRFDIDDVVPPAGREALLLATVSNSSGAQPITTRPELSIIQNGSISIPIVTIATGKYLGLTDIADTSVQSVYSFKDALSASGLGDLRSNSAMVQQTLQQSSDGSTRTISQQPVDWLLNAGWYLDLSTGSANGERVTIDPEQQFGILNIVSNIPDNQPCISSGGSWFYALDYRNGSYLPLAVDHVVGQQPAVNALVAGAISVKWNDRSLSLITDEAGNLVSVPGAQAPVSTPNVKRVSWRELDD
jgi:type IV pilus assembly protein PilY1